MNVNPVCVISFYQQCRQILCEMSDNVVVEIVEQPGDVNRRFRYECEGNRSVIFGASDTTDKHSYPAVRVLNYTGTAIVLVSCVTTEEPHW